VSLRIVSSVVAVIALVAGAGEGSLAAPAGCDLGWYVVDGTALLDPDGSSGAVWARHSTESGSSHGRIVALVDDMVSLEGICAPVAAKVRHRRRVTKVKAAWPACDGVTGPVKLRARIDASDCMTMRGALKVKKARPKKTRFTATRTLGEATDCTTEDTFTILQKRVFGAKGCRVATCHGASMAGGLDLRYGTAHFALVDQPATTAAAAGKMRVVPGDPDASFLWQKLTGTLAEGEGARMPAAGAPPLDALELAFVRSWIEGGAPAVGRVDDAPCLPHPVYEPALAPAPPPGGYQIAFEGPTLQPDEEIEGCMWVRVPNTEDFAVGRWEYTLNPGTHHFAMWDHVQGDEPEVGVFRAGDIACARTGAPVDGRSVSGAGEAPYFVDAYPPGVGRVVKGGQLLGLNPHYFNEFDVPIPIKIWINMYPVEGALEHEVETLLSGYAPFDGRNAYNFLIPPFSTATHRLRMKNALGVPMAIFQLSSHQHQRGKHFTAWNSSGEKIFENFDWAHPAIRNLDDPMVLAPDDFIDFECEWDNGVTREVRRCGDSPYDTDCTPGDPVASHFGITAQDEMCFLTGFYYTD